VIVPDTTVLVHVTGGDHPLREPCRRIVHSVADGQLEATTTVEVLQDFSTSAPYDGPARMRSSSLSRTRICWARCSR